MAQKVTQTPSTPTSDHVDICVKAPNLTLPTPREEDIEAAHELIHISSDIVAGWSKYQNEILSFYSKRVLEDLELQQKLLACKSVHEIWTLQRSFFEQSSKQYSDEMQKLTTIAQQIIPTELTGISNHVNP